LTTIALKIEMQWRYNIIQKNLIEFIATRRSNTATSTLVDGEWSTEIGQIILVLLKYIQEKELKIFFPWSWTSTEAAGAFA
jgi:hypothetical protein